MIKQLMTKWHSTFLVFKTITTKTTLPEQACPVAASFPVSGSGKVRFADTKCFKTVVICNNDLRQKVVCLYHRLFWIVCKQISLYYDQGHKVASVAATRKS